MRAILCILFLCAVPVISQAKTSDSDAGRWTMIQGRVAVKRIGVEQPLLAREGERFLVGDLLETGADGRAQALLIDNTTMNLSRSTSIRILHYRVDAAGGGRRAIVKLQGGKVRFVTPARGSSSFTLETPHASLSGGGGLDLVADVTPEQTTVAVLNGGARVKNITPLYVGSITLATNQRSTITAQQPPTYAAQLSNTERKAYRQDARMF